MTPNFPKVDRNRLISKASKELLAQHMPASWHEANIDGDADFGFDRLVHVASHGGVQHTFLLQLKGTESPSFIADGATLSFPLKNSTLNLYANVASEVMLVVAVVALDERGKLIESQSEIYWQWMSAELKDKRGSTFKLEDSDGTTTVHVPVAQTLRSDLEVLSHLEAVRELVSAGMTLEDLLQRARALGQVSPRSYLSQLIELASQRPAQITALLQSGGDSPNLSLPDEAHTIKAFIRAGNTELAESALEDLGTAGFGPTPALQATLLSLRAKVFVQRRRRAEAVQLFDQAYALDPSEQNLLPLAEMRFLDSIGDADTNGKIAEIRNQLYAVKSDDGLSLRVRIHAFLKEFTEAQACLEQISETEQLMPRLVLLSTQRKWGEVVGLMLVAEASGALKLSDLTNAQLVAARGAWSGATERVGPLLESGELPLAGALGTNLDLARHAWDFGFKCLKGLQTLGWSSNIEVLAPTICGVAGLLGHQDEALSLLAKAAAHRPEYSELQLNTELLAISAEKPEQALSANLRQPESVTVLTRRASLLFDLGRFSECEAVALTIARSTEELDDKVPMALAMGFAAAHRLGHLIEAGILRRAIESRTEWAEYIPVSDFVKQGVLKEPQQVACSTLRAGLAQYPDSWMLAANLYSNLAVDDATAAAEVVKLAKTLRARALLKADEAAHLVAAHITLQNWHEAAFEAASALERFDADDRLLGMAAIAEEMEGHTGAALALLERALAVGTERISAVHNYLGLCLRLGRVDAARSALDRLLGLITDELERIELMRLSALIYAQQERADEAFAAIEGLGQLINQDDEQQEGMFLSVFMAVKTTGASPSNSLSALVERRINAFCAKWPESMLFRCLSPRQHDSEAYTPPDLLTSFLGQGTQAQLIERQLQQRQASRGEFPVPFLLRPGFVIPYVSDPFQLWELAKRSHPEEQQFHLNILLRRDEPKSPDARRDIPLLDLSALLVLDSLALMDRLFTVFERVAVPAPIVAYVSQHANGVLAVGPSAEQAKSILAWVNRWVSRVDQPSSGLVPARSVLSAHDILREYIGLSKSGRWLIYCDDAICRAMILAEAPSVCSCTTVDYLDLLDQDKAMAVQEISERLGLLANWNASITVSDRLLIASLVGAWPDCKSGTTSLRADAFRDHKPFSTLARAIWHPGKSVQDLMYHMAHLLVSMLKSADSDQESVGAVLANWFNRVRLLKQSTGLGWRLLCYPVLLAVMKVPDHASPRFVSVLRRAVAASVNEDSMSQAIEAEVVDALGTVVGSVGKREAASADELLRKLRMAMPMNTTDGDRLLSAYVNATG